MAVSVCCNAAYSGTNVLAQRGMGPAEMEVCADLVHRILGAVEMRGERDFALDEGLAAGFRSEVRALCRRFPIPDYPAPSAPESAGDRRMQEASPAV